MIEPGPNAYLAWCIRFKIAKLLVQLLAKLSAQTLADSPALRPSTTAAVYGFAGTEWPLVGGANGAATPHAIFESAAFQSLYVPGRLVRVYACGNSGLRVLSSLLGLPLRKIGATEAADVRTRISELSCDNYGGAVFENGALRAQPGFDRYVLAQFDFARQPSPHSSVSVEPRAISVRLPQQMTFQEFEDSLQAELRSVSLNHWAASPEGAAHMKKLHVDPNLAQRFTDYRYGDKALPRAAEEILIFRPRRDGDRLLAIIESVILRHLKIG